jgi:hypothetical protein
MKNLFKSAEFTKKVGNQYCAVFDHLYICKVANYVDKGARLRIFLTSFTKVPSDHFEYGKVYINEISVEYILKEIRYFKKNKKWRKPE